MKKINAFFEKNLENYLYITLGVLLVVIAYNFFIVPLGISTGGVSGIGIIINILFGIPIALVVTVLNVLLLLITFFFLDRETFYRSIYGSFLFPFLLGIIPSHELIVGDTLLAIIFGSLIMGIGFGLVFLYGGSTGGTSLIPYILKKYCHLPIAVGFFLADAVVISLNALTGNILGIFYGIFAIIIMNVITDYFETGFSKKKSFYIISDESDKIQVYIHEQINRGTTILHATGGYLKQPKKVIMGVVSLNELQKIKAYTLAIDESAFIIIGSVTEVHGHGFTLEKE